MLMFANPDTIVVMRAAEIADLVAKTVESTALRIEAARAAEVPPQRVWHTQKEAADYMRCSVKTVQNLVKAGRLKPNRGAGDPLYHITDLDAVVRMKKN